MDDAHFEAAWQAHSRAIMRYCAFSTGSHEDAEDLTSEVFSRFLGKGDRVNADKTEAWLFAVARNLCASHHRVRCRASGLLARIVALGDVRSANDASHAASADSWRDSDLWSLVHPLDERSRLAIYLRVVEDRPFAQVAQLMGVSQSAAKMTYYRALKRVRDSLMARREARGEQPDRASALMPAEDNTGVASPAGGVGNGR